MEFLEEIAIKIEWLKKFISICLFFLMSMLRKILKVICVALQENKTEVAKKVIM